MFKWFNLKTFLTGLIFSSVLIGWLALYRANHPHHQGASIPTCHSAGQIIAGSQCSPAPGVTNGRYVCRAKGAALETVCETWGKQVEGGVVYHGGVSIPPSVGTIRCTPNPKLDQYPVLVSVIGNIDDGLIGTTPPSHPWEKIEFGMDANDCWREELSCSQQKRSPLIAADIPETRFTPRVVSIYLVDNVHHIDINYFDLTKWTIAGGCVREGCGMCRDGERCVDADGAGCIVSSVKDEPRH
jgi:hypothetical protein